MNSCIVPLTQEAMSARMTEIGIPDEWEQVTPTTMLRLAEFGAGALLMVHHTPDGNSWLCNPGKNQMAQFEPKKI